MNPVNCRELMDVVEEDNEPIFYESEIRLFSQKMNDEVITVHDEEDVNEIGSFCRQLEAMFPNVDKSYIKKICLDPPFDDSEGDRLLMLINHLLSYDEKIDESQLLDTEPPDENDRILSELLYVQELEAEEKRKHDQEMIHTQLFNEFMEKEKNDIERKMKILENVLPDANPDQLKRFIEDENVDIDEFVASKLEVRDYEKRDEYYANLRKKEIAEQYTTGFDVKTFLVQFPEPFTHFEDPHRTTHQQEQALLFLKSTCDPINHQRVEDLYKHFKFNISLTYNHLQEQNLLNLTLPLNIPLDNIPILQEVAFLQNKGIIRKHLETLKQKEEKELQALRAKNLLLECQCCFDELKPYDCVECDNQHIFCKSCVIKGTNVAIANGKTSIICFNGCEKEISLNVLRKVLPTSIFETLIKKRQDVEVSAANLSNLVSCPFCPYVMELDPQIQIFTCKNPECMKISCCKCKKLNHLPIKCEDVLDEHKSRLFIEEKMSEALIRRCYNCQKPFIKNYGCNKMQCSFCKALWCYLCRQPIQSYSHFNQGMCHQHDHTEYDRRKIEETRAQTVEKLRTQFPDLKLPNVE